MHAFGQRVSSLAECFEGRNNLAHACAVLASEKFSMKAAMKSEHAARFNAAKEAELEAHEHAGTWTVTPRPPGTKLLRNHFIFTVKRDAKGNIEKFKARLVVDGSGQIVGVDVGDIFAPVVRFGTVRLVLALAAKFNMTVRQADVTAAFFFFFFHHVLAINEIAASKNQKPTQTNKTNKIKTQKKRKYT